MKVKNQKARPTIKSRAKKFWDDIPPEAQHEIKKAGMVGLHLAQSRFSESTMSHIREKIEESGLSDSQRRFLHHINSPPNFFQYLDHQAPRTLQDPLLRRYPHLQQGYETPEGPGAQIKQKMDRAKPFSKNLKSAFEIYSILKGP